MTSVLVLRPMPGAEETAARAARMGLNAVVTPLFVVHPVRWEAPAPEEMDAVMLTSANAPRHAGAGLGAFLHLPCFAVGEATAAEARHQGFGDVRPGAADASALAERMAGDGVGRVLHLCGRDHIALERAGVAIVRRVVYAAEPIEQLPHAAIRTLASGAVALIHSPRAGATFGRLVDEAGLDRGAIRIAAISEAAAEAAGGGWRTKEAASEPRDEALLELAAKLCKTDRMGSRA